MNRDQFKKFVLDAWSHVNSDDVDRLGLFRDEEPFWIPEFSVGRRVNYFCECWTGVQNNKKLYKWADQYLLYSPLCFMIDSVNRKEWWGFDNEKDMALFLLKWA